MIGFLWLIKRGSTLGVFYMHSMLDHAQFETQILNWRLEVKRSALRDAFEFQWFRMVSNLSRQLHSISGDLKLFEMIAYWFARTLKCCQRTANALRKFQILFWRVSGQASRDALQDTVLKTRQKAKLWRLSREFRIIHLSELISNEAGIRLAKKT